MSLQRTAVDPESLGRWKVSLVKETVANNAHACWRGKLAEKFGEAARALNEGNARPWNSNGKHCNVRYKILLANFRRADRARALASGTDEEFGGKRSAARGYPVRSQ
jgi:hypothetical protein